MLGLAAAIYVPILMHTHTHTTNSKKAATYIGLKTYKVSPFLCVEAKEGTMRLGERKWFPFQHCVCLCFVNFYLPSSHWGCSNRDICPRSPHPAMSLAFTPTLQHSSRGRDEDENNRTTPIRPFLASQLDTYPDTHMYQGYMTEEWVSVVGSGFWGKWNYHCRTYEQIFLLHWISKHFQSGHFQVNAYFPKQS